MHPIYENVFMDFLILASVACFSGTYYLLREATRPGGNDEK